VRTGPFWRGTWKKAASSMLFHLTRSCRESFAQVLEAFLAVWSLRSGANPQLDKLYCNHLEHSQSERHTLPAVVQSIIADLRGSSGTTRPLYAPRSLRLRSVRNSWSAAPVSMVRCGRFCRTSIASRPATGWPNSARFAGSGNWGQPRSGFQLSSRM
jgi:hypothetical protein